MGFNVSAANCWHCLGIVPSPNSAASEMALDQRRAIARTLLMMMTEVQMTPAETAEKELAANAIQNAYAQCL